MEYCLPLTLLIVSYITNSFAQNDVQIFRLDITYGTLSPDNFPQQVILINRQFPGPELRALRNNWIIVCVTNYLDEDFTIHWHGIHQKYTQDADGVPYVTQYPIRPNETYRYEFNVGKHLNCTIYH